jgi:hypothetical protein
MRPLFFFPVCLQPIYTVFSKSLLTQTHQICLLAWHSISKSRLDSVNTRTGCVKLFLPVPKAMEIINNSSVSRSLWFVMEPIGKSVINMFSPITMACLGASMWLRVKEPVLMGWLRQFRLHVGLYCFPLLFWLITPFVLHHSPFYLLLLQYPSSDRNVKFSVLRRYVCCLSTVTDIESCDDCTLTFRNVTFTFWGK